MVTRDGISVWIMKGSPKNLGTQFEEATTVITGDAEQAQTTSIKKTSCRITAEPDQSFFVVVQLDEGNFLEHSEYPDVLIEASIDGGYYMARKAINRMEFLKNQVICLDLFRDPRRVAGRDHQSRNTYSDVKFTNEPDDAWIGEIRVFVLDGIHSNYGDCKQYGEWHWYGVFHGNPSASCVQLAGDGRSLRDHNMKMRCYVFDHHSGREFVFGYAFAGAATNDPETPQHSNRTFQFNPSTTQVGRARLASQNNQNPQKRQKQPRRAAHARVLDLSNEDEDEEVPAHQRPRLMRTSFGLGGSKTKYGRPNSDNALDHSAPNPHGQLQRNGPSSTPTVPSNIAIQGAPQLIQGANNLQTMTNEELDFMAEELELEKKMLGVRKEKKRRENMALG